MDSVSPPPFDGSLPFFRDETTVKTTLCYLSVPLSTIFVRFVTGIGVPFYVKSAIYGAPFFVLYTDQKIPLECSSTP